MIKVICALLRYTDDEKSLILNHEKHRQTVSRYEFNYILVTNLYYLFRVG